SLLHFFAHPGTSRGNAADFARRALDTFLACEVRLLIIDDLHFLRWRAADGVKVSNHLKFIANEFPVTLVLVGVGLTEAGLFTEGRTQRESTLAQTARRTTPLLGGSNGDQYCTQSNSASSSSSTARARCPRTSPTTSTLAPPGISAR